MGGAGHDAQPELADPGFPGWVFGIRWDLQKDGRLAPGSHPEMDCGNREAQRNGPNYLRGSQQEQLPAYSPVSLPVKGRGELTKTGGRPPSYSREGLPSRIRSWGLRGSPESRLKLVPPHLPD